MRHTALLVRAASHIVAVVNALSYCCPNQRSIDRYDLSHAIQRGVAIQDFSLRTQSK